SHVVRPIVCVVAVEVVDLQRYTAGRRMAMIPAALGAFFTADFEQVPPDVTGYFADGSATHLALDPALHEITISFVVLALVAAELAAIPTNRFVTQQAVCALAHARDA